MDLIGVSAFIRLFFLIVYERHFVHGYGRVSHEGTRLRYYLSTYNALVLRVSNEGPEIVNRIIPIDPMLASCMGAGSQPTKSSSVSRILT